MLINSLTIEIYNNLLKMRELETYCNIAKLCHLLFLCIQNYFPFVSLIYLTLRMFFWKIHHVDPWGTLD